MIHVTLHIQPLHARRTIKSCEVKLQLYDVVVYDDSLKGRHCHMQRGPLTAVVQ